MIEKRFVLDDDGIVVDKVDLSMYIDNEDCCEKLNELSEETQHIKNTIKEAYNNERTQLGKSVLKQLIEVIM